MQIDMSKDKLWWLIIFQQDSNIKHRRRFKLVIVAGSYRQGWDLPQHTYKLGNDMERQPIVWQFSKKTSFASLNFKTWLNLWMKLRLKNCLKLTNTLSIHYSVVAKTLKYTRNFGRIIGKMVAVVGRVILWFPCYFLLPVSCFPVLRILYSKQLNTHWPVNIISLYFNPK